MDWGDAAGWTGAGVALVSLAYAYWKGRGVDAAVDEANKARTEAAAALRIAAAAQERSARAQERAAEVAESQAGARLRVRWDGQRFKVTNTGAGAARSLSAALRIEDWHGDVHPEVLYSVPPHDDPSTPSTGWRFSFPIRMQPPDALLGQPAFLTCFYVEEVGGNGRVDSESFRLVRDEDGKVRIRGWG